MRLYFFSLIFLFSINFSFSQIQKKTWIIGGSANAYVVKGKDEFKFNQSQSSYMDAGVGLQPYVGYFIFGRMAIRSVVSVKYSYYNSASTGERNTRIQSYTIGPGPFLRTYLINSNDLGLYVQGSLESVYQNTIITRQSPGWKSSSQDSRITLGYKVGIGLNYFVLPGLAIDLYIHYDDLQRRSDFNGNQGRFYYYYKQLAIDAGIQYFIHPGLYRPKGLINSIKRKGGWLLGGNLNLDYTKHKYRNTEWSGLRHLSQLNLLYFLFDKIAIGQQFNNYIWTRNHIIWGNESGGYFTFNPLIRYYIISTEGSGFFLQAAYLTRLDLLKENQDYNYPIRLYNGVVYGGPGYTLFLTPNLAMEGVLNYHYNRFESDEVNNLSHRLQLNVGFYYFFNSAGKSDLN
ncbi:MAG: hypothetical protein ACK40G_06875 [Cytophagaceae bacterium]